MSFEEKSAALQEESFEALALRVLKTALEASKKEITVSWVERKFDFGYSKSSYLLRVLEEKGYLQSELEMKEEGRTGRRILVAKDFFEHASQE